VTPPLTAPQGPPDASWIIAAYLRLPDTPTRARHQDRLLASQLHQRGVPMAIIEAAFLLATTRRTNRPHDAEPLAPIRSLRYFLPVIDELLRRPPAASYLTYLRQTVARLLVRPAADKGPKKDAFT
jgi:hypothetical protein